MPPPANKAYQLKVSLLGARPPIWRRLLVAPDTTFQDLHRIIQLAMGWQACHLHMFQAGDDRLIGDPAEDFDGMQNFQDETMVAVSAVLNKEGQALTYDYDFGDSWEHEVRLEKVLPGDQGASFTWQRRSGSSGIRTAGSLAPCMVLCGSFIVPAGPVEATQLKSFLDSTSQWPCAFRAPRYRRSETR